VAKRMVGTAPRSLVGVRRDREARNPKDSERVGIGGVHRDHLLQGGYVHLLGRGRKDVLGKSSINPSEIRFDRVMGQKKKKKRRGTTV